MEAEVARQFSRAVLTLATFLPITKRGPRHGFAVVGRGGRTKRPKPQGGFLQLSFFRRHTFEVFSEGFYVFVLGTCRREALRSFFSDFGIVAPEINVTIHCLILILTALRGDSALSRGAGNELMPESDSGLTNEKSGEVQTLLPADLTAGAQPIYCANEDYETAEMIGNKMLLHMASAYRMIDGDKQDVVPEIKPLYQRKVLFEQLKAEYKLQDLISEAKSQGVSRSSAIRWNNQWIEQGLINKENHGNYRKVA